ncbi:hypothetical protein ACFL2J_06835 [Candidatus Omnitrophota bacterium]
MKNLKKWQRILAIVVIVFICLGIVKNPLIKTVVTVGASKVLGAPVHIDGFAVGVFKQSVRIKGFKIYNPKGFPKGVLIDIPEVSVDYSLPAILTGKLYLPLIVLNLREMVVIKNKDGLMNVDALKVAQKKEEPAKPAPEKKEVSKKPSKQMAMQIDVAKLTIGKVVFKDFSQGGAEPSVQVFNVGIEGKEFKDITSAQQFATLIMVEAMGPTAIKGAAIYGAATVLGVAFLPAGVAAVLIGNDSGSSDFNYDFEKVYNTAIETVKEMGEVIKEDKGNGVVKGKVSGSSITIEITELEPNKTQMKVSARKFMLPKPEVAEGVIYEISQKLK